MDYNQRLKDIRDLLGSLQLSESGIGHLEKLVDEADGIATAYSLDSLKNNLWQTRYKCLDHLLANRDKPQKRIQSWEETITHFRQDLSDYLSRLPR